MRPSTENRETSIVIGVISDTHGLLRPEALQALKGCETILHAGDIGLPEILESLRALAPVTAIRGNIDTAPWARNLPENEFLEIAGIGIYVLHDLSKLDLQAKSAGIRVVVSGHSHVPKQTFRDGVLYFNPGSAGPRRFELPVTIGMLFVEDGEVRGEIVSLLELGKNPPPHVSV